MIPRNKAALIDLADMALKGYDEAGASGDDMEGSSADMEITPVKDDARHVFTKHTGSVFCVATDPSTSSLVVSGGEDDKAYVWTWQPSPKVLFECTGHKDSVICAGFSHDSKFVATGDMSGLIKAWKVETQKEVWYFEVSDLEWLEWHMSATVLLAGTSDGDVWMWKIPSSDTKTFQGHGSTATTGKLLHDGKHVCVGYEDGAVKIWDLKTGGLVHTISGYMGHKSTVTSIACQTDTNLILTGSTDRTAKLINAATGKVLSTFNCGQQLSRDAAPSDEDSVEAVGFCHSHNLIACGTLNGILTIWDTKNNSMRHCCRHEAGITRLQWCKLTANIYTSTLDGVVHLWDGRSGKMLSQWTGHTQEILDMDIARKNEMVVTASGDHTVRIF